jgi:hypothetical protein
MSLTQRGDKHLQEGPPPVAFHDAETGARLAVQVVAADDASPTRSADVAVRRPKR